MELPVAAADDANGVEVAPNETALVVAATVDPKRPAGAEAPNAPELGGARLGGTEEVTEAPSEVVVVIVVAKAIFPTLLPRTPLAAAVVKGLAPAAVIPEAATEDAPP